MLLSFKHGEGFELLRKLDKLVYEMCLARGIAFDGEDGHIDQLDLSYPLYKRIVEQDYDKEHEIKCRMFCTESPNSIPILEENYRFELIKENNNCYFKSNNKRFNVEELAKFLMPPTNH